jgi:hypothetical protein
MATDSTLLARRLAAGFYFPTSLFFFSWDRLNTTKSVWSHVCDWWCVNPMGSWWPLYLFRKYSGTWLACTAGPFRVGHGILTWGRREWRS